MFNVGDRVVWNDLEKYRQCIGKTGIVNKICNSGGRNTTYLIIGGDPLNSPGRGGWLESRLKLCPLPPVTISNYSID